jgi:class 3 adenylate cyclase/tetratricopeptide (TPR) repeat protein
MNCPNCQHANPAGARFCSNCGTPLPQACTNCGTLLQPGARFCHQCGQPVPAPGAEAVSSAAPPAPSPSQPVQQTNEVEDQLQRYIPRELLSRLESARRSRVMEGERRVVTILFCDVEGSTLAASRLDPEEWAEIINGAFAHMIQPIYRYEGTVARLQGDGLLAFFGAPIAHEDDPQRAILAGLEINQAIRPYGEQVKERWGIDFNVRVGINTGLVVVGEVGSDLRVEYTALGDAINIAARMEQNAQPGTVLVAGPTYKLVAPLFEARVVEGLVVKGRAEPLTAYEILSRKAQPGSLRGLAGLNAPLIGRKAQMDLLWEAAFGLQQGRGQIVSVIAEAGLGKSRLVTEFRRAITMDPDFSLQWLEGRALSYDTATPFAPFSNLLTDFFELEPGSRGPEQYARLAAALESLFSGRSAEIAPFFAALLELELEGELAERVKFLQPAQLRGMIFAHMSALVERLLAEGPVVLYMDDLHWADSTSIELLESLLPLTDHLPLLVIAAFRPRRQEPSWGFHELAEREYGHRYQAVMLAPLDNDQARELVANLLEIEDLPENVRLKILEKSEGNPFFVEEVIRSLLDSQLVARVDNRWQATQEIQDIDLPDTLVGVITARLDRLDDTTKYVLQAAAVLGREFRPDVLEDVAELPDSLEPVLVELQRRELVREKSRLPQHLFTFKHVLTQEAAYSSILLSNRRELHRRAAEVLIVQSPEAAGDIARHLLEARQPGRAVPYLLQAADRAAHAYAVLDAIGYYQQVVDLKAVVSDTALLRQAYEGLGNMLVFANRIPEAQAAYQEMLDEALNIGDTRMQISALSKQASVAALRLGDFQGAENLLVQADSLSRQHEEKSSIPEISLLRCLMCTAQADFERVVEVMDEVVEIGHELGSPENVALGLEHISTSQMYMGDFEEAFRNAQEGLRVARQIGDRAIEAGLLGLPLAMCYIVRGDFEAARSVLQEALQIALKIGAIEYQVASTHFLSEIAHWRGEYEQALRLGQQSLQTALPIEPYAPFMIVPVLGSLGSIYLEISEQFIDKISEFHLHALRVLESPFGAIWGGAAWADLGHCAIALGDLETAEQVLEKSLNYPNTFSLLEEPRSLGGMALLHCTRGELDEAARLAREARQSAEEHGLQHLYPLTALIQGKVLAACGEWEASLAALQQARDEAGALGMRPVIWQAHAAAVEVETAAGRLEQADAERSAAESIVIELAGEFEDQELREAFLRNALAKIH